MTVFLDLILVSQFTMRYYLENPSYKRSPVKEVFAEACISVLTLPANRWNSYEVNKMYEEVLKEFSQKCSFSKQTEIFRTSTEDDEAYLRTIDEENE